MFLLLSVFYFQRLSVICPHKLTLALIWISEMEKDFFFLKKPTDAETTRPLYGVMMFSTVRMLQTAHFFPKSVLSASFVEGPHRGLATRARVGRARARLRASNNCYFPPFFHCLLFDQELHT